MNNLQYCPENKPGYQRKRTGRGFSYFYKGKKIKNPKTLAWISSLVIPPAWDDVWISTNPNMHLLATGRDKRDRKQYIYNERWITLQQQKKFNRLYEFGMCLPKIRSETDKNIQCKDITKEKIISAIVKIMDETHMRIGNERYSELNHSYGVTTLRRKHIDLLGKEVKLEFIGKSRKKRKVTIYDDEVIEIIKNLVQIPGYEIFKYYSDGEKKLIQSEDVNEFLKEISGENFTCKDFRTWAGTRFAAEYLLKQGRDNKEKRIKRVVEKVAKTLGNTPSVCKEYYIHPKIIDSYMNEKIFEAKPLLEEEEWLDPMEKIVLSVLNKEK